MNNKNLRFCFRIDKSIGLAQDEDGNNVEAYVCIKSKNVSSYELPSKIYKDIQDVDRAVIQKALNCDINLITPITLNEYLDNTEEEDDHND